MFDKKLVVDYFLKVREEIERLVMIERELKVKAERGLAVSVIGPRRSGKTTYMMGVARSMKEFFFIDFEHVAFRAITPEEVMKLPSLYSEIFGERPEAIFLDEVQRLCEWECVVRSFLNEGKYVFISGSSSKLMSKEIATQLRGRSMSYVLLPFSFREYLKAKGVAVERHVTLEAEGRVKKLLREFLLDTSYPEVVLTGNRRLLQEYYNTILYNDFVERFELKSIELARFIFEFLLSNFSREFSVNKIHNFLKSQGFRFGKNTLYSYLEKIPETLSIFFVERLERSAYKKLWPRKVYVADLGLANIVCFEKSIGQRMENAVFLELLRKTNENPLTEIYYFRDSQGYEVDFLIKEGLRVKQLIQVTYANNFDEIDKREWRSLIRAYELFKRYKPELLIITWDYEDEREISWFNKRAKIKFVPLWRWLLNA
jgi:predicted AAA+ superfamily ATPase